MNKSWLVIQLPDKITADDIEYEEDESPEEKAHREGYAEGFNAGITAVQYRMTQ